MMKPLGDILACFDTRHIPCWVIEAQFIVVLETETEVQISAEQNCMDGI